MEKTMLCLNSIKSRCFMLVVCFILLMGVTSCNNDDFEVNAPDGQKELSNAELIELALSQLLQTRANLPFPVVMASTGKHVHVGCDATEDMVVYWGDGSTTPLIKDFSNTLSHTYSDNQPSHTIFLEGSSQAIKSLYVDNNELFYLDVTNNTSLGNLNCLWNNLSELNLEGCPELRSIVVGRNNLSSIDVTHLSNLEALHLSYNQLTEIDVSKNLKLHFLNVEYNQITDLDLINNTVLDEIILRGLSLKTINNLSISSTSFAVFPQLKLLDISYTPFISLDLSKNPLVSSIYIDGTVITQLDISNLQIKYLNATNSNLTNLIYTSNNLLDVIDLRIDGTPFEKLSSNLYPLLTSALPDRNLPNWHGLITQGHLYTNSLTLIAPFLSYLTAKNWVVNQ